VIPHPFIINWKRFKCSHIDGADEKYVDGTTNQTVWCCFVRGWTFEAAYETAEANNDPDENALIP
jgi:hypothetical protein